MTDMQSHTSKVDGNGETRLAYVLGVPLADTS